MAKTIKLTGTDLEVKKKSVPISSSSQRGTFPSADLVPLQFRMTPEFVKAFKQEALNRGIKLNELFEEMFAELVERKHGS